LLAGAEDLNLGGLATEEQGTCLDFWERRRTAIDEHGFGRPSDAHQSAYPKLLFDLVDASFDELLIEYVNVEADGACPVAAITGKDASVETPS